MMQQESELGFGTEYEKVIFSQIINKIGEKYGIDSCYNYPANNLLGNPRDVTGSLSENANGPDLLWNFCEYENQKDQMKFISDLESFNPKHILIVTQNYLNPGTLIHYLYHRIFGKKWDHGHLSRMTTKPLRQYIKRKKTWEILETGTFDAPWFILDIYEVGKYLKSLIPKSNRTSEKIKKSFFENSPRIIKNWASHHNYILIRFNKST